MKIDLTDLQQVLPSKKARNIELQRARAYFLYKAGTMKAKYMKKMKKNFHYEKY